MCEESFVRRPWICNQAYRAEVERIDAIGFQQLAGCLVLQGCKPKSIPVIVVKYKLDEAVAQAAFAIVKNDGVFTASDAHNKIL